MPWKMECALAYETNFTLKDWSFFRVFNGCAASQVFDVYILHLNRSIAHTHIYVTKSDYNIHPKKKAATMEDKETYSSKKLMVEYQK